MDGDYRDTHSHPLEEPVSARHEYGVAPTDAGAVEGKSDSQEGTPLSRDRLFTQEGLHTLAVVAATLLKDSGVAHLFVNDRGLIEVALPGEVLLDGLPEAEALRRLAELGYEDAALAEYLRGRDARTAPKAAA